MTNRRGLLVLVGLLAIALPALADSGAQHRVKQTPPVKMGTSGGSKSDSSALYCCGGTLGSLVRYDGALTILSNNHVLARSGQAAVGEDAVQPGLIDSNCSSGTSNIVGDFVGNIVPLGSSNVDVGISTARTNVDTTGAIIDVGVPCSSVQTPTVGLAVKKSGRTTGQTTGTIQSVNTSVTVQYQKGCGIGRTFNVSYTNQVIITPGTFSGGGDSGSLIVSNDGTPNPVALLFAGSSSATVGNRIQDVVNAFTSRGHTFTFVGNACAGGASMDAGEGQASPGHGPAVFGATPDPADQGFYGPSPGEIEFASRIKDLHETDLFKLPGVIGVGVGAEETETTRAAIVVYYVSPDGVRQKPGLIPTEIDGVKVRVIPTDPFVAR